MATWQFSFSLAQPRHGQLSRQIAAALVEDIRRGRLRPGELLPGTRTLSRIAGVNRITVLAAYDELSAEGWVTVHPARGTFVSTDLPLDAPPPAAAVRSEATWSNGVATRAHGTESPRWLPAARGVLNFRSAYPDTRIVRLEPLARAYRRVLLRSSGALLGYAAPEGHPRLRRAVASMLRRTRALPVAAGNVMITRGSQMALSLVARVLLRGGDAVIVEDPGYRHGRDAFRQAGAEIVPVAVDDEGLDVEAVAAIAARRRVAAIYVTPHHQLPTTVTMSARRRARLVAIARAHGIIIVEDDYDHEFHFDGAPVMPIASQSHAEVIYVGTLSKVLAPGLRIGYVVTSPALVAELAALRQTIDMNGDPAIEAAVAELIDEEEVQRHVRRAARIYRARRDLLASLLNDLPGAPLRFTVPAGGIGVWAEVHGLDVDAWAAASARRGAAFLSGRAFTCDERPIPFVRLGYACLNEAELRLAVARMAAAMPEARATRASGRTAIRA